MLEESNQPHLIHHSIVSLHSLVRSFVLVLFSLLILTGRFTGITPSFRAPVFLTILVPAKLTQDISSAIHGYMTGFTKNVVRCTVVQFKHLISALAR